VVVEEPETQAALVEMVEQAVAVLVAIKMEAALLQLREL
jgi:hypothetical protein